MANSQFEHVRRFEQPDAILPNVWIVIRIDGRGFHKLSAKYAFTKPNDLRALNLMNHAATSVLQALPDICLAYGQSDEYSFVLPPYTTLYDRRASKLISSTVSLFTAAYVHFWPTYFSSTTHSSSNDSQLTPPFPSFDARAVAHPTTADLRDYMAWRQADCHVNNLYNTTFWALVQQGGLSNTEAEEALKGTVSADKNEILFKEFGVNYNQVPAAERKGSVMFRDLERSDGPREGRVGGYGMEEGRDGIESGEGEVESETRAMAEGVGGVGEGKGKGKGKVGEVSKTQQEKERRRRQKARIVVEHVDVIKDDFWVRHPWILEGRAPYRV